MKKLLILFSILWLASCSNNDDADTVITEPVPEDVLISSTEDLAAFVAKNITHLKGSLTLNGDLSEDLSELESLQQIDGTLLIIRCSGIIKLSGLKNLKQAGSIIIDTNFFRSLEGFDSLETVTNEFRLYNNNNLGTLHGLEKLSYVGYLNIDSQSLNNISALQSLTEAESITITSSQITNLESLSNLRSVKMLNLSIFRLESLLGLENLVSAETINISGCPNFKNLHGLESLTSVGTLNIKGNSGFTSLEGLQNLQKANIIMLTGNTKLTSLAGLQSLTAVGNSVQDGGIYIWDNGLESLDGLEHITAFKGSLILEEDLTNFCPLQTILSTGELGTVSIQRYGKPVPSVQDIINGNCTVD